MENDDKYFMMLQSNEVPALMDHFKWDKDTIDECTDLDEIVRYTAYEGYDFISLVYPEDQTDSSIQRELNIFVSHNYLVVVMPERPGPRLSHLGKRVESYVHIAAAHNNSLNYLYYLIFDSVASDYAQVLEQLEDEIGFLAESIEQQHQAHYSNEISFLRKKAYNYKKLLRALSYVVDQISVDEHSLFHEQYVKYFQNITARIYKLYDFSESLNMLAGGLISLYDSKLASKTNENLNKLTVITLFFGPLTVITGIYGMNFTHMPELNWLMGYPFAYGLMVAVTIGIYVVMKRKKWF